MFIQVQLLNGLPTPLWYSVPPHLSSQDLTGKIIQAPVKNYIVPGFVLKQSTIPPASLTCVIKPIIGLEKLPNDPYYTTFLNRLSIYYQQNITLFIKRIHSFLVHKQAEPPHIFAHNSSISQKSDTLLTDEQRRVCEFLTPYIENPEYKPTILHGITGSGKTEVYKQLFLQALSLGKTSLFLLPEVTLAIAFEKRLKQEMPDTLLYGFHSGKTPKEKMMVWNNLIHAIPMIIIGVHLPILLPISNLGLIVVDEEHDTGFQEKKHPKINSKEAALIRAQHYNIPIILGSATPSISTLYNAKTKKWHFFQLKKRFSGTLPAVTVVSLTENKNRKEFWISKELQAAINDRLHKKEQTIIFINRRGVSFFVQCTQCTFIFRCSRCSVSLTLHNTNQLLCHYCSLSQPLPSACPECHASEQNFLKKGIGTQKVVHILQSMFPHAIIARADHDTTTKKKEWARIITQMHDGTINIIVGTQTITKGLHFPGVTLVGVLWADLHLHFPVYNATETALQQLIQVAGRAGRNSSSSSVIIQTIASHDLFNNLNEEAYLQSYAQEMEMRSELCYPPYYHLVELELKHVNEIAISQEAHHLIDTLLSYAETYKLPVTILGPSLPPVSKIKNIHSRKIYLKSAHYAAIITLYQHINKKNYSSSLYFTPNPV
jgi:primosomal protein N' (replication factor Y)